MLSAGTPLGIYRLVEPIGSGGMGEVWKAEDTRLGRIVAIKVLPAGIAADAEAIARMRREARTAAQLNHPSIAHIYAFEEEGERLFIVMEFVDGEPLSAQIQRGMSEAEIFRAGRGIAEALAEAHAKGIVHRDIKPDNVLISGSRVKVLDFGIAKRVGVHTGSSDPTAVITQIGMIVGTIQYMSPEQALGRPLDARTDIFSLGVVLYQAATGRLPFIGETVTETMTKIVRDDPEGPGPASSRLAAIIAKCLKKNPDERYASAADLAAELDAGVPTEKTAAFAGTPRRLLPLAAGGAAVILGLIVALGVLRDSPQDEAPASPAPAVTAEQDGARVSPPVTGREDGAPVSSPSPAPAATTARAADPPSADATRSAVDRFFAEGLTDLEAGRTREARRGFDSAYRIDPSHQKAILGLAIVDRRWARARELVREIEAQHPDDPDVDALRRVLRETEAERRDGGRRRVRTAPTRD